MRDALQQNLRDLEAQLTRFRTDTLQHFVNGESYTGSTDETFSNATPIDNSVIGMEKTEPPRTARTTHDPTHHNTLKDGVPGTRGEVFQRIPFPCLIA